MNPRSTNRSRSDNGRRNWRRTVAPVVIAAVLATVAPQHLKASWRDNSGNLPGMESGKSIAILAVAAGGAVAATFFLLKRKGGKDVKMRVEAPRFDAVAAGQPQQKIVSITNLMDDPITIKEVSIHAQSGEFSLADSRQTPFTVGPGEQVGVAVTCTRVRDNSSKGQMRIVASSPKTKKDTIQQVQLSSSAETAGRRFLLF